MIQTLPSTTKIKNVIYINMLSLYKTAKAKITILRNKKQRLGTS